jgi:hypothetical protein
LASVSDTALDSSLPEATNLRGNCTDCDRSTSPFWRSRTSDGHRDPSPRKQGRDSGLVVGASYSHADLLAFDNLYAFPYLILLILITQLQIIIFELYTSQNTPILITEASKRYSTSEQRDWKPGLTPKTKLYRLLVTYKQ